MVNEEGSEMAFVIRLARLMRRSNCIREIMAAGQWEPWDGAERVLRLRDTSSVIFAVYADWIYNSNPNLRQPCPYEMYSIARFVGLSFNRP
jgi:hypothetical protein